jgi:uncharacterized protein (TIGR00369 family)
MMTNASHQITVADAASSRPAALISGLDFLKHLADGSHPAPPFARETDIWIVGAERGRVLFAAMPSKRFYNPLGTVHGGWISTLLDSAMGCAVHSVLLAGQTYTTVDMTVNFVRPCSRRPASLPAKERLFTAADALPRLKAGFGTKPARSSRMAQRRAW